MAIRALWEDEHLLVLDKPAGLVVHPAAGHWSGTLLNGLLARHPGCRAPAARRHRAPARQGHLGRDGGRQDPGGGDGAVACDRRACSAAALPGAGAWRTGRRRAFSVEAPIGRDPVSRLRMAVVASGKPARTDVRRVAVRDGFSAVYCSLHTGRTHQIRVHLAHRGHPLVADAVYGGKPALGLSRQALHAWHLLLPHPVTGVPVAVCCAPPPDFETGWLAVTGAKALESPLDGCDV
jgi:23S rRNA pseudouridine1911/1915/1917 synthase